MSTYTLKVLGKTHSVTANLDDPGAVILVDGMISGLRSCDVRISAMMASLLVRRLYPAACEAAMPTWTLQEAAGRS